MSLQQSKLLSKPRKRDDVAKRGSEKEKESFGVREENALNENGKGIKNRGRGGERTADQSRLGEMGVNLGSVLIPKNGREERDGSKQARGGRVNTSCQIGELTCRGRAHYHDWFLRARIPHGKN